MNPMWDAAEAALALVLECLGERCAEYGRQVIESAPPVEECTQIAVVIGQARAQSGSCVGRVQMNGSIEVWITRCCEPTGSVNGVNGYTPPSADDISAAVACLTRDAWAIYNCVTCSACDVLGAVRGVTACCNRETGPPEITFRPPSGGCRTAVVRMPLVFTACCPSPE